MRSFSMSGRDTRRRMKGSLIFETEEKEKCRPAESGKRDPAGRQKNADIKFSIHFMIGVPKRTFL